MPSSREPARPLGRTLRRHVRRLLLGPLLVSLAAFALIALAVDLVLLSDLAINRGLGAGTVAHMAWLRVVPVLGRTLPFALLVSTCIAAGRMAADRERMALEAAGVSPLALLRPVLPVALALTAVVAAVELEAAPRANLALNGLVASAARERSTSLLRSGVVASFGESRLEAREVSAGGDRLRGVALTIPRLEGTAFARRGALRRDDGGPPTVILEEGVVVLPLAGELSELRFDTLERELRVGEAEAVDPLAAATAGPLLARMRGDAGAPGVRAARAELHRRLALSASALLLGLLAVPLSLARGSPSRASGLLLGLAVAVGYYALVQLGDALLRDGRLPVAAAAWLPDLALLAIAAGALAAQALRRPPRDDAGGWLGRAAHALAGGRLRARRLILERYVLTRFAGLSLLCVAVLLSGTLLVDVLDNLKWFAKYRSTPDEVLRYYAVRLPILAARVLPLSLVAAAATTVSLLSASGELLGMRACGISGRRALAPILAACALLAAFYHVLANEWVPRASAAASRIKQTEIKDRSGARRHVFYRAGDVVYEIGELDPLRGVARGVTFYELDGDGLPRSRTDASRARHLGGGLWQLVGAARLSIGTGRMRAEPAAAYVELGRDVPAEVDTGDLPLGALWREIRDAERDGYDATRFRVDLHARLASTLSCVVLPALALAFAAGGPPFPTAVQMLVASTVLVLGHALLSAGGAALGYGGVLAPAAAGWGPIAAVAAGGAWLLRRGRVTLR